MNKLILQVERRANRSLAQRIADTDNRLSRSMYDVIPREGADTGRMLACGLQILLDEQRANDMAAFNRSVEDTARAFTPKTAPDEQ
jgi:hypothetical protein